MQLLGGLALVAGSRAVRDLLDGSADPPLVSGSTLVDQTLFCSRCQDMTVARMRLDAWIEFDKSFKQGLFTCSCGGVLLDHKPLILTP